MFAEPSVSRRNFLVRAASLAAATAGTVTLPAFAAPFDQCPIASFSKVFQELELDYEASAELAAEVGVDGIDCPVRPGGQVSPERVADDLPRYAEILARRKQKLLLLTTAILSPSSPHAETILRTAKRLGVTHYRLGYWSYKNQPNREKLQAEVRAQLKDLAALTREVGMKGVYQNHSGRDNFGARISDLREALDAVDIKEIGVAFDPSHAIIELGDGWRDELDRIRRHVRIAYVKDVKRGEGFVKFGAGALATSGWFTWLRKAGYSLPISMHTEYEWAPKGFHKTRERLVAAMKSDLAQVRRWIAES